jgi:hypothetical protein
MSAFTGCGHPGAQQALCEMCGDLTFLGASRDDCSLTKSSLLLITFQYKVIFIAKQI